MYELTTSNVNQLKLYEYKLNKITKEPESFKERLVTANDVSYDNINKDTFQNENVQKILEGNKKNFDYLKDQVKFLGFGEDENLQEKLKSHVYSDAKEFSISTSSDKTSFQNKASFELHFNRSAEPTNVFFNKFDARLTNEKRDVDLVHTFAVKNNGFTAKQAINLLEGRSVKTEITNPNTKEKETAFVKLKLNEEKNDNGNFKLQVYNKN
ncbi:MAG: hypothetical protein EOO34_00830 [Cyanobacteriota bacterium]|nr:MAG: hypothetical protein EOO34_00830 [Cyanobacteriota bacterium]